MRYFKLTRAINLYVAVDWQGDREIERRGEGGGSAGRKRKRRARRRWWAFEEKEGKFRGTGPGNAGEHTGPGEMEQARRRRQKLRKWKGPRRWGVKVIGNEERHCGG